jgi:hypothetical protein
VGDLPTHSRNSSALWRGINNRYASAIVNTPRGFHYETDQSTAANERRAMLLLEMARTNSLLWSRDLSNAAWLTGGIGTATLTGVGLDGTANSASVLADNDATAFYNRRQTLAIANDGATHTARFWIFNDGGATTFPALELSLTGGTTTKLQQVMLNKATGAAASSGALGGGGSFRVLPDGPWWIVEVTLTNNATGNTTLQWLIYPGAGTVLGTTAAATTGGAIVGQAQVELNTVVGSSPIFTTSAASTRGADSFYWNFPPAPQAMIGHLRLVEGGTSLVPGAGLWAIDTIAGSGGPRLLMWCSATGVYQLYYQPVASGANYVASLATGGLGDTLDLVWLLTSAGSIRLVQSINGAAVTDSGLVAGAALPAAWADTKVQINSHYSGGVGLGKFAEFKVVKYADVVATTAQGILSELTAFELDLVGNVL